MWRHTMNLIMLSSPYLSAVVARHARRRRPLAWMERGPLDLGRPGRRLGSEPAQPE